MSKSALLRAVDVRAAFLTAGECRELGDDAVAWRGHLFPRLAGLVGAGIVMGGELTGFVAGNTRPLGLTDWGWQNGFNRGGWERAIAEMDADPTLARTAALARYVSRVADDDGVGLSRADLVTDTMWHRSWDYRNLHVEIGIDHTLWCFRRILGADDEYAGVIIARAPSDPDFTARQKALVREIHAVLVPLVGGRLARFTDPSPSALPLRTRQVLRCLLEGDGDKQVAARLGLARMTVNQHTKRIYTHFGVVSRAELLARWVRRNWPIGGWADDFDSPPEK